MGALTGDRRSGLDRRATRRARRAEARIHQHAARARPRQALLGRRQGRRQAAGARVRPAQHRQLRDRMARLSLHHLGQRRIARTDSTPRSWASPRTWPARKTIPSWNGSTPRSPTAPISALRAATFPALGALHRHAARLWLRRLDGRVDSRLPGGLGRRMGHGRALQLRTTAARPSPATSRS